MASNSTRLRAMALYKELHRLGRDYPDPSYDFQGRVRRMFEKNRHLTEKDEIEDALKLGEYIKKGAHSTRSARTTIANRRLAHLRTMNLTHPRRLPSVSYLRGCAADLQKLLRSIHCANTDTSSECTQARQRNRLQITHQKRYALIRSRAPVKR
ncbi:hypothetical protein PC9H_009676 [Pleurotus ostreatus]|uniref:Complex 1 LYR protein domain-containing protein n=1 Tax=Pleurotus ostreatus TaxID=5322 RepID=A0A8H6ZQ43_PLEOS|nr:uncharacterized protein PC9H_009676 [Pleurotus ostreatus]KAF7424369.1 hypothetical protein PC9H_009676 [Pleurotus ostreatus]